jgi:hypothetical protein
LTNLSVNVGNDHLNFSVCLNLYEMQNLKAYGDKGVAVNGNVAKCSLGGDRRGESCLFIQIQSSGSENVWHEASSLIKEYKALPLLLFLEL